MIGIYDIFQIMTELGLEHFIQTDIDNPQIMIRGVGTLRLQLDLREVLEVYEFLFVPEMTVRKISIFIIRG